MINLAQKMNISLRTSLVKLCNNGYKPAHILDIGACKGNWALEVRSYFPGATITMIEAIEYKELQQVCARFPNISYKNAILSDSVKQVQWYEGRDTGDSYYKEVTVHYAAVKPIDKTTTTLDLLVGDKQYDFIKIDCQGAELDILKGAGQILQSVKVILLEVPFAGVYNAAAPSFAEYIAYLDGIGFTCYDICELHHYKNELIQIDIIFVRKGDTVINAVQNKIVTR